MLTSLALIFLSGLAMNALCKRLRLPGIIGMLAAGMLLGPYALNLLDGQILDISPSLRQMALVVILLRAGLTLNLDDLKKVGRPAVLLSCVPAGCEILGYVLLAPKLLRISPVEAAVTGAVLSAVSPAVVPRMVRLIDERRGTDKSIPQMILAGASCDDVFVIVLFSIFTSMAQGGQARAADFIGIPLSIVLGIALGAAAGLLLALFFRSVKVRGTAQLLILLSLSFLLPALETALKGRVPLSGLLAVMSMACALKRKSAAELAKDLSLRADKAWIAAEILLFMLVGAAVDIRYTAQAAIGGVPLALGLSCGQAVLSTAVMGILLTAPLGAIAIDRAHRACCAPPIPIDLRPAQRYNEGGGFPKHKKGVLPMARFDFRQKPFRLYGVPFFDSTGKLERVPEDVAKQCNDGVATLSKRCPGARLRFCTDSRKISFRITLASIEPDIGMSIYSCQSGNVFIGSRYAGLVKPSGYDSVLCQGAFEKDAGMEDVTLFLPRNEPVAGIEIELDDGAAVEAPTPYAHAKPILFYGSSITEGGCCSKPANAYNALLSRWLDADYYNFGFSGSARGELAMADYITTIEKSVFVMDYDHNSPSEEHLAATHEPFFRRIREREPELPIVILTRPDFDFHAECAPRREIIRATYEHAKAAGDENVYFLDGERFFGDEDRDACTNDCTHPNDLGMYRMAKVIEPVLRGILERAK